MLDNVMPQRGVFFSLLVSHTDRLVAAGNATLRLVTGLGNPQFDTAPLIDEVNLNETSADDLKDDAKRLEAHCLHFQLPRARRGVVGHTILSEHNVDRARSPAERRVKTESQPLRALVHH